MKIMVCYDGSEEAEEALRMAEKNARAFNSEVVVVTSVASDNRNHPDIMKPFLQGIEKARSFFHKNRIPCLAEISFRDPGTGAGEDLVSFAAREKVDEIIIGINKQTKSKNVFLGPVADWVLLNAGCPVLGVKRKRRVVNWLPPTKCENATVMSK